MKFRQRHEARLQAMLERARADLESARKSLAEGAEKKAYLEMLEQKIEEHERLISQFQRTRVEFPYGTPLHGAVAGVLTVLMGYYLVAGLLSGKFLNLFLRDLPYVHRSENPEIFLVVAVFNGLVTLIVAVWAVGFIQFRTKQEPTNGKRFSDD